jgi:ABC-type transport system substrate-binding protein
VRKPIATLVASAFACALMLTSALGDRAAGADHPLRITVGTLGTIGSLDPRHGFSPIALEVWNLEYPTLTSLDPKTLDPAPGLAASWSPAPSGKGWIYNLAPGLTWSDGQPVTAEDVAYSIEHGGDWPYTYLGAGESFLSRLTAVALNSRSVQVTPTDIDGNLPGLLVHVVPEHVFSKVANLDSNLGALGVSDGTWHVTGRTRDSVRLDTAGGAGIPALQQIVFRTYPNADALIDALAHKQVDVVSGLPAADADRLAALSNVTVDHAPDGRQFLLRDRLPNEKIRQAISLAIDRTKLVADAVHGVGTPGVVPLIASGATWALDDSTVQSLTESLDAQPDRARQLIAEAPQLGRKLIIGTSFGDPVARQVAALVRRALAAVGVEATIADTDENDGVYSTADLLLYDGGFSDNPFYPNSALDGVVCDHCAKARHLPSTDFTTLVAIAHERIERVTSRAKIVGLFEPDTLQAFRTDNVTGFLREPQQPSLVVFAPTTAQYAQLVAAPPPPGEQLSNTFYAAGAVVVLALCGAAFGFAAWIRRRSIT